jgi:hypothetical protein
VLGRSSFEFCPCAGCQLCAVCRLLAGRKVPGRLTQIWRRLVVLLSVVVLPWTEPVTMERRPPGSSVNKGLSCRLISAAGVAVQGLLCCRGGGRRKEHGDPVHALIMRRSGRCICRSTTSVASVCQPNPIAEGRLCGMPMEHCLFNLQVRRPFHGVATANLVFFTPSGVVPGGVEDGRRRLLFN